MLLILVYTLFLISNCTPTQRIRRSHSRVISTDLGKTIKLQWDYSVGKDEELVLFYCGYRNKKLDPESAHDPPVVPLAYTRNDEEFVGSRNFDQNIERTIRATDTLNLKPFASAFRDVINNVYVLDVQLKDLAVENAEFLCVLRWKVEGKHETSYGGETTIALRNKPSIQCPKAVQKSSNHVRGEIFLGAILFDLLLIASLLSASLLWKRKQKGYRVPKKGRKKKKRDLEKGDGKNGNKKRSQPSERTHRSERSKSRVHQTSKENERVKRKSRSKSPNRRRNNV